MEATFKTTNKLLRQNQQKRQNETIWSKAASASGSAGKRMMATPSWVRPNSSLITQHRKIHMEEVDQGRLHKTNRETDRRTNKQRPNREKHNTRGRTTERQNNRISWRSRNNWCTPKHAFPSTTSPYEWQATRCMRIPLLCFSLINSHGRSRATAPKAIPTLILLIIYLLAPVS